VIWCPARSCYAEAHRPDAKLVGFFGQARFQGGQLRIRVFIIQLAKEHFLRCVVGRAAVPADGHAQDARRAALSLGFVNRIQYDLAHAGQVTPRAQSGVGSEYCAPTFSHPPPLSISSMVS